MVSLRRRRIALAVLALSFASIASAQERPKEIVVTFVDKESGKPIAGASAWVRLSPGGGIPLQKADAEGKLVVPMSDPKLRSVSILAAAPGSAMMRVTWDNKSGAFNPPATYTFALPKGVAVGGVVVDSEGQPIPEAKLTLHFEMNESDLAPNVECGATWRQIVADEKGRWSFGTAPDKWKSVRLGTYDLERGGNEQGYYSYPAVEGADAEKLRQQTHEFRLPPARQIVGRVIDGNGKPIPGATVRLGDTGGGATNSLPPATVDPDGTFLIGVKPDVTIPLTFTAKGFAPELIKVTNTADLGMIEQVLQPAKTVTGQVVGPDGAGIAGASVSIDEWRGTRALSKTIKTNGEGRFTWTEAPADAVTVNAYANGFALSRDVPIGPDKENIIKLSKPVVFRGKVIDAETKQPIAGVATDIGIVFGKEQAPYFRSADGSERPASAADGTFEITFDLPYYGRIVRVEKEGYARADSQMVTMNDGDQTFTYELKRSAGMSGSIVDATGKPTAGVTVYMATPGNAVNLSNGESQDRDPQRSLSRKTDESGKFTFPTEDGDFALVATGPAGYARIEKSAFKSDQPITLSAWAKIEGDVFIGSKPAAGAQVQAWSSEGFTQDKPQVHSRLSAMVDSAGHFVIERVPPGTWMIGRYAQVSENGFSLASHVNVDAKAGESQTIRIGGNGRPVVGRVEIPDELEGKKNWQFEHFTLMSKMTELPPQPKTFEELQKMTKAEQQAVVESPEWKAWAEAWQTTQRNQRRIAGWLKQDGTFRIEDVPPGTYTADVSFLEKSDDQPQERGRYSRMFVHTEIVIEAGNQDEAVETPILELSRQPMR